MKGECNVAPRNINADYNSYSMLSRSICNVVASDVTAVDSIQNSNMKLHLLFIINIARFYVWKYKPPFDVDMDINLINR
jgi:hypothetical protein